MEIVVEIRRSFPKCGILENCVATFVSKSKCNCQENEAANLCAAYVCAAYECVCVCVCASVYLHR